MVWRVVIGGRFGRLRADLNRIGAIDIGVRSIVDLELTEQLDPAREPEIKF